MVENGGTFYPTGAEFLRLYIFSSVPNILLCSRLIVIYPFVSILTVSLLLLIIICLDSHDILALNVLTNIMIIRMDLYGQIYSPGLTEGLGPGSDMAKYGNT